MKKFILSIYFIEKIYYYYYYYYKNIAHKFCINFSDIFKFSMLKNLLIFSLIAVHTLTFIAYINIFLMCMLYLITSLSKSYLFNSVFSYKSNK